MIIVVIGIVVAILNLQQMLHLNIFYIILLSVANWIA